MGLGLPDFSGLERTLAGSSDATNALAGAIEHLATALEGYTALQREQQEEGTTLHAQKRRAPRIALGS